MLNEDFEHKLKNKLLNAAVEPSISSWESIDKNLSAKDDRKIGAWYSKTKFLIFFVFIAVVGFATYISSKPYVDANSNKNSLVSETNSKPDIKQNNETSLTENNPEPTPIRTNDVEFISKPIYIYHPNLPKIEIKKESYTGIFSTYKQSKIYSQPIYINNKIDKSHNIIPSIDHNIKNILLEDELISEETYNELNNIEPKRNENDTIYKFIIGASTYLISSYRHLKTTNNANQLQKDQVALRNKIEYRNIDFNGGLFIKAQIKNNWYIGIGINIYNCSEKINFAFKSNVKDSVMPAIDMKEEFKTNNLNNSNVFKLNGDSIFEYTQLTDPNNSIINHYYFNEIPVNISYIKYDKKWNWFVESGLSFNKLTVIHSSLVDIDKVGFTTIIDKVNYVGIKQYMLNANLASGFGYNISQTFSIQISAQFKYALSPLIDFGYAKQNPNALGLGLVFAKRF